MLMKNFLNLKLDKKQIFQIFQHLQLLKQWNKVLNLSSISTNEDIVKYHYRDSIMGLSFVRFNPSVQIFDLGSGAGFPGVVAAILNPNQSIVLVEKCEKKISFLRLVVSSLKLENVRISQLDVKKLRDIKCCISRAFLQPQHINKILHIFCKNGQGIFWVSPNFKFLDKISVKPEIFLYKLNTFEKRKVLFFKNLNSKLYI